MSDITVFVARKIRTMEPSAPRSDRGGGARRHDPGSRFAANAAALARRASAPDRHHVRTARVDAGLHRSASPPVDGRLSAADRIHHRDGVATARPHRGPGPDQTGLSRADEGAARSRGRSGTADHRLGAPSGLARRHLARRHQHDHQYPPDGHRTPVVSRDDHERCGARFLPARPRSVAGCASGRHRPRPFLRGRQPPYPGEAGGLSAVTAADRTGHEADRGGDPSRRPHHRRRHGVRDIRPGNGMEGLGRGVRERGHPVPRQVRAARHLRGHGAAGPMRCASSRSATPTG